VSNDFKDELILKLRDEGKSFREIADIAQVSNTRIQDALKANGVIMTESKYSQALRLFSLQKTPLEVAAILSLPSEKTLEYYTEYVTLDHMGQLAKVYEETGPKYISDLLMLHKVMLNKQINHNMLPGIITAATDLAKVKMEYTTKNYEVTQITQKKQNLLAETFQVQRHLQNLKSSVAQYRAWNQRLLEENHMLISDCFKLQRY
jgi:phage antirepressor YoqD-like protein